MLEQLAQLTADENELLLAFRNLKNNDQDFILDLVQRLAGPPRLNLPGNVIRLRPR